MNGPQDDLSLLVPEWLDAAATPVVDRTIRELMSEVQEEIARERPLCVASGRCCNFERFGHRLYLTGLEAAWTWRQLPRPPGPDDVERALARGTCPFLTGGLCGVHLIRPLGCRLFFCDPRATQWQQELHERLHAAIRALHESAGVSYRYAEWRALMDAYARRGD